MYHIGKVLEVWASKTAKGDDNVQATLEMWDENVITLKADTKVAKQLNTGAFVLVDYTPVIVGASAVPRQMITKVLDAKAGERTWTLYKDFHGKQKAAKMTASAPRMQSHSQDESYLG